MKILKYVLVFILFVCKMEAQDFEGKITYTLSCTSKNSKKTNKELSEQYGTLHQFYIKDGNYKSIENGKNYEWNIYNSSQNKLYRKHPNDKVIGERDCSITYEYPSSVKLTKDTFNILGYKCQEVIITFKCKIYKFYYNNELPINPGYFLNNNYDAWYRFLAFSKALPLKVIIETDDYAIIKTAIKVEKLKLNASLFNLPKGAKVSAVSVMMDCYK